MYKTQDILRLLADFYGPRAWQPRNEPLKELIQTVLAQHTTDLNAERSFDALWLRFGNWQTISEATVDAIAEAIQSGGLARQKAPRIKAILKEILQRRGDYSLDYLAALPFREALEWLTSLHGVGPKTARCVLLFALGMPCIPVDTHVHRVTKRLGLIGAKTNADQAHDILEQLVGPENAYRFHVYLIEHGRKVCKAPRPRCAACPLQEGCPSRI